MNTKRMVPPGRYQDTVLILPHDVRREAHNSALTRSYKTILSIELATFSTSPARTASAAASVPFLTASTEVAPWPIRTTPRRPRRIAPPLASPESLALILAHLLFDEQRGDLGAERGHKGALELLQQKLGSALGSFESDITRHAIGNDDIEVT